jgi:hypothetical protein
MVTLTTGLARAMRIFALKMDKRIDEGDGFWSEGISRSTRVCYTGCGLIFSP